MRKYLGKMLIFAVLTAVFLTVTAFAAETGTVNADALRLRSEPSTDSSTVTYLNNGATVEVLEDLGDWYYISANGSTGYVSAEYISFKSSSSSTSSARAESAAGQIGVITGDLVNFRGGPSMDDEILTTLTGGSEISIISVEGEWCSTEVDGQQGYVKADYVAVNGIPLVDPKGIITGDVVNVRSAPSTDSSVVIKLNGGTLVDLIALEDDWYSVSYNGQTGYIRSDYLNIYVPGSSSGLGADIVATAKQYMGTRYSYGGSSPRGFDCSGFTMYIYSQYGYSLPHSATSQWQSSSGTTVARADLQPGDLVFFCDPSRSNGKACSHVGIYIGDGDFIHASSSSGVRINSLYENYYGGYYVGAKRMA